MLYQQVVLTREQAFCHLLLYFSLFEDETFKGEETYQVFSILKLYPMTAKVNFADEVNLFFDYKESIQNIEDYFTYLTQLIDSEYTLPVLFNALQVALSDGTFSEEDQLSLVLLSNILGVDALQRTAITALAISERKLKLKGEF